MTTAQLFPWIKSLHIIAIICWMAAMFYLPRLFVYHSMSEDQISKDRFKIMERKLLKGIMTPAMIASLIFGFWLLSFGFSGGWVIAKIALVGLLVAYHIWCASTVKKFANDDIKHGHVFYRWLNEAPVLVLVGIVILVVVKPF